MVTAAVTWESPSALISRTSLVVFYGISTILQIFRFPISAVLETIIACPSSAYFRPFSETFKGKVMTGGKIGEISSPLLSCTLFLAGSLVSCIDRIYYSLCLPWPKAPSTHVRARRRKNASKQKKRECFAYFSPALATISRPFIFARLVGMRAVRTNGEKFERIEIHGG